MQTYCRLQNWSWVHAAREITPRIVIGAKWFRINANTKYDILNQAINLLFTDDGINIT
jgi:hypothetical protein